jgi:hypothetical protein
MLGTVMLKVVWSILTGINFVAVGEQFAAALADWAIIQNASIQQDAMRAIKAIFLKRSDFIGDLLLLGRHAQE